MTAIDRLPPGQQWIDRAAVFNVAPVPSVDVASYRLTIKGSVRTPFVLTLREIRALPCMRISRDIHCVTGWSVKNIVWEGVRTRDLVDRTSPDPGVRWVFVRGLDGYTTNVPIEEFGRPDCLLAYRMDDAPISPEHGHPLRLVIPSLYGWKSAKYVTEIEFITHLRRGYWEERGYHDRGDPWTEERYRD